SVRQRKPIDPELQFVMTANLEKYLSFSKLRAQSPPPLTPPHQGEGGGKSPARKQMHHYGYTSLID
ncbi:MAG: hypothetical protein ACK40A_05230, partial [Pannonibacter indicus]